MDKKKVDVVLGIKVNVCYTVEVAEVNPAAIREALLNKDPSEWAMDPNFYEYFGSAFRGVVGKMTDEEILNAVTPDADIDLGKTDGQTPLDTRKGIFPNFDSM